MKKILYITLLLLISISCKRKDQRRAYTIHDKGIEDIKIPKLKEYNIGQIIYLKPDSIKVVVTHINQNDTPNIKWFDKEYGWRTEQNVERELIYEK